MSTLLPPAVESRARAVRAALARRQERLAVQLAVRAGARDIGRLADLLFCARHPERVARPSAYEPALLEEWRRIRDEIVRPVVAAGAVRIPPALPPGARAGVSGPVSEAIAALERILGRDSVTNDYAVRGHDAPSLHHPGSAPGGVGHAADFLPKRSIWDRLFAIRAQLHELYGPWGLYRDGRRVENDALQRRHEHHIHVSYLGSAPEIARLLGPPASGRITAPRPRGRFKDDPSLRAVPLAPAVPISVERSWPKRRRLVAATYNRIGGLLAALAQAASIEPAAVLAVWLTESAGTAHVSGRAVIRFENHLLYRAWGTAHDGPYAQHFRHGGYRGAAGRPWENHAFREQLDEPWQSFHGRQELEYRALALARRLAGDDVALQCISIGGPQILVSHYRTLGYPSPRAMYDAWQADERAHVLGFFDLCAAAAAPHPGDLMRYLRERRFDEFARRYNGPGQVQTYATWIRERYEDARQLLLGRRP